MLGLGLGLVDLDPADLGMNGVEGLARRLRLSSLRVDPFAQLGGARVDGANVPPPRIELLELRIHLTRGLRDGRRQGFLFLDSAAIVGGEDADAPSQVADRFLQPLDVRCEA